MSAVVPAGPICGFEAPERLRAAAATADGASELLVWEVLDGDSRCRSRPSLRRVVGRRRLRVDRGRRRGWSPLT